MRACAICHERFASALDADVHSAQAHGTTPGATVAQPSSAQDAFEGGSCFYCGEPVEGGWCDEIGRTKVWLCGSLKCSQEFRAEQRDQIQAAHDRAQEDSYDRYR